MKARRKKAGLGVGGLLITLVVPGFVAFGAEENLSELAKRLIELRGQVEELHDRIDSEKRQHRGRMTSLSQRRSELESQIQRQELELKKFQQQLAEHRQETKEKNEDTAALTPVVTDAVQRTKRYVQAGLPFKPAEREAELDAILEKLEANDITAPRALNQIWGFLEDEFRIARQNEMYRQEIRLDGDDLLADVIRLGMVMLFFRTTDGRYGYAREARPGAWAYEVAEGEAAEQLQVLFGSFERQVRTGFFEVPNPLAGGAQ